MPNMPKISFYGKTDVGLKRSNNEDIFIIEPDYFFGLVADGMGGASAGELASELFGQAAKEMLSQSRLNDENQAIQLVQQTFTLANNRILSHVKSNPKHEGMGCTAELIVFTHNRFIIGHVGDSRTYRIRDGEQEQITCDHSLVQQQLDQGIITPEEARHHSMRNIILRAVGTKNELALDLIRGDILPGDVFLLCSDGLTDMVDDPIIHRIMMSDATLAQKADRLINIAKSVGGKDNITVVLSEVN